MTVRELRTPSERVALLEVRCAELEESLEHFKGVTENLQVYQAAGMAVAQAESEVLNKSLVAIRDERARSRALLYALAFVAGIELVSVAIRVFVI